MSISNLSFFLVQNLELIFEQQIHSLEVIQCNGLAVDIEIQHVSMKVQ